MSPKYNNTFAALPSTEQAGRSGFKVKWDSTHIYRNVFEAKATVLRGAEFFAFSLRTCRERLHLARLVSKVSVQYSVTMQFFHSNKHRLNQLPIAN